MDSDQKTDSSARTPGKKTARKPGSKTARKKAATGPKLSRTHPPLDLEPAEWQRGLRRQFGRELALELQNIGTEPFFSEFSVRNPESKSSYRVAIRGLAAGENFCSCPDYASNELGTCKHIEFTLARLQSRRGATAAFRRGFAPAFSEIWLQYGAQRSVRFRASTDCPPSVLAAASRVFSERQDWLLPSERFGDVDRLMAAATRAGHELRAYDDAMAYIAGRRDADQRAEVLDAAYPAGSTKSSLKGLLKVPLYPYQAEGALFAARAGRALIGDEMGLGKTIQAIAAMELLMKHFGVSRVLVVCPASLKYQWQSEMARFAGRQAEVVAGGKAQRREQFADDGFCRITNYEKLQPDLDLIAAWAPELVIVDEAQRIKNWNTIAARALKRIDSAYALVLTGTPLENKLEELISIVQFVDQHRLGPTWKLLHEHQVRDDETGRVVGYRDLAAIGQTLAPVMIRRRKSEVAQQLPSRRDQNLLVPMTEAQLELHNENADVVARIVQRWRRTKFLSDKDQRLMTCALQNMRMSCNSTYLLDQETDHGVKADELATYLEDVFADPDEKAVVFSQWVRTHEIVRRRLDERGIGYVLFHGGVPAEKRPELVARFADDPHCRVFLSTDAGAAGLNLQHASTIVNMDLPWNPALLEQRIGRIHRMGQKRPVQVLNFIAKGTIEEGMLSVLAFKRSLSQGVLDGAAGEVSLGGSRLARFMNDVQKVTEGMQATEPMTTAEERPASGQQQSTPAEEHQATGGEPPGEEQRRDVSSSDAGAPDEPSSPQRTGGAEGAARADLDPWGALLQLGTQLATALAAAPGEPQAAHPWIERDPASGARSLRLPLPPPDTAQRLADALTAMAQALSGRNSGTDGKDK